MKVEYLELVTPDADKVCDALSSARGLTFSEPVAALGNARVATLSEGGRIGVRAPMHGAEAPATRPYYLAEDLEAATKAAEAAGATIAVPPMELPGEGKCSVLMQGGVEYGFWQN